MSTADQQSAVGTRRSLTRSSPHRVIAGVCAGISECFGISLAFTRTVFVVLALANGLGVAIYLLLILIIPHGGGRGEAVQQAIPCPAPSARKSLFAYASGAISIFAALVASYQNLESVVKFFAERFRPSPHQYAEPVDPDYQPVIDPYVDPPAYPSPVVASAPVPVAMQGSASIQFVAGGTLHTAEIEMDGQSGESLVGFYDYGTGQVVGVYQDLMLQVRDRQAYLVGSNPRYADRTPASYLADTFRIAYGNDQGFYISDVCDSADCFPVETVAARMQVQHQ